MLAIQRKITTICRNANSEVQTWLTEDMTHYIAAKNLADLRVDQRKLAGNPPDAATCKAVEDATNNFFDLERAILDLCGAEPVGQTSPVNNVEIPPEIEMSVRGLLQEHRQALGLTLEKLDMY